MECNGSFGPGFRYELHAVESVIPVLMDNEKLKKLLARFVEDNPDLKFLPEDIQYQKSCLKIHGKPTLLSFLMCGLYPQSVFPQLAIIASHVPGRYMGSMDERTGVYFLDSKRIEGTLDEMLEGAMRFVERNIQVDSSTGAPEYSDVAIREALLNALVHRDYSVYTEGRPIQLIMFSDRMEIRNPVKESGNESSDLRNCLIMKAMELMGIAENMQLGMARMQEAQRRYGLPEPVFETRYGEFIVTLHKSAR